MQININNVTLEILVDNYLYFKDDGSQKEQFIDLSNEKEGFKLWLKDLENLIKCCPVLE